MKNKIYLSVCLLLIFLSGCKGASSPYFEEASEIAEETEIPEAKNRMADDLSETAECYVYICGAVKTPGVYELPAGSRIYEAVAQAGGLLENACEDGINQAEKITDGQMIKIPTKEEAADPSFGPSAEENASDGRVNLNTADVSELMTLPGIGESKAMSILSYREEKGGFSSAEEIMNITGIKEGVYSKIKDYITVD